MNLAFRNRQNRIWLLFADEMPDGTVRNVSERLDQLFEDLLRVVRYHCLDRIDRSQ
jgi:hypothetical protein